ncbi:MAG: penicillin acylase family protein [Actinobacteria bacterium]|nr:penicillin acylase family protein [Actinomycetota bacterium]
MSVFNNISGSILKLLLTSISRKRLPQINGELSLQGLIKKVEIIRDRWGIPHIYADNLHDLFFAQGFTHAQDRLWQMEIFRRTAVGKLSELFGEIALETDRASRTFGFNRIGKIDLESASKDIHEIIHAYTDGVNAFIKHPTLKMPVEFTLLKYRVKPWEHEDTMALSRLLIWQLSHAWYGEIIRAQIIEKVGFEHAAELEIHYPENNPVTLSREIEFNRIEPDGSLKGVSGPFLNRGKGSNSWVVSGERTDTGMPILCNDMHLSLMLPSIWYEVHLVAEQYNVTGVSLPGVPMIMVGHNTYIGWGMTLAFTDCEDLYIEEFDTENGRRYKSGNDWLEAQIISETIDVKGKDIPAIEEITITKHGPIISDVAGYPAKRLSVNSMALKPCPALLGWLSINTAKNWDDFVQAMKYIEAPQLGVTYADVKGNIGYWVTGKVPIRASGFGEVPSPGWSGEFDWTGEVPFEEMPHCLNPKSNVIITCNNRIIPDNYPYFLGNVWMNGYRALRSKELIDNKERLTVEDFKKLQSDFMCIPGLNFAKHFENIASDDSIVSSAIDYLKSWDGNLTPESIGGTIYEVTRYTLIRNILERGLGKDLTDKIMGKTFNPVLLATHEFYGHDIVIIIRMLDNKNSWWIKQAGGYEKVLIESIEKAVKWLKENFGNDTSNWQWGKIHRAIFPHAMGIRKPLDKVFNCGPLPIGGDNDTICQTAIDSEHPYDNKTITPTYRQIIDFSNLSKSIAVHAPGQSGHLGSIHYNDLAKLWIKGKYHPILWTRSEIENEAEGKLNLISQ